MHIAVGFALAALASVLLLAGLVLLLAGLVLLLAGLVLLLAGADQAVAAVALEGAYEHHAQAVDHFEILHRGVPGVEQDGAGFEPLVALGADQHLSEVLVLGLAVRLRGSRHGSQSGRSRLPPRWCAAG